MAKSKQERLELLNNKCEVIEKRMFSIKKPTLYAIIDMQMLQAISHMIEEFINKPDNYPKIMVEHLDYLNVSLDVFINDLDSGVYGEENTS